jgi:glutamate-1-semialdehyde 2,1-aminomutase
MAVTSPTTIDRERVEELTRRELAELNARTRGSEAMYERARRSLSGGVASSYQLRDPWPIYLVSGEGAEVTDVDGNRYWDFHNGFGSMVQGHGNPAIVEAVRDRVALGTHFAAVTEDTIVVAEELVERFHLPLWRFVNSGSEATMDRARADRARDDREDLRLLPRPPRRRDGLDRRAV